MAVTQSHFRFGVNELAESTHGWYAAEDVNPVAGSIPLDTTFLLRFCLQCDATLLSNIDAEFQYRLNGGAWTQISAASNVVRAVTTTVFTNGQNTTKRLSGTGTFESSSAGCTHDGISGGTAFDIIANGNGETECSMQLRSSDLVPGDLVEFRLTRDGGVLLDTYAVTPAVTIPQSASSSESAKIDDGGYVTLFGLTGAVKIADVVVAALIATTLSVSIQESAKISDAGLVRALTPEQSSISESAKVSDIVLVTINPERANASENFKIADQPTVALGSSDVNRFESFRISDSALGLLNPEQVTSSDSLKISDSLSAGIVAAFSLSTSLTESFKVTDITLCSLNPEEGASQEQIKVDDGGFVEIVGLGNPIRISEGPPLAQLVGITLAASLGESLKAFDGGLVFILTPESVDTAEGLRVADAVSAALIASGALSTSLQETSKVVDVPLLTLNPEQSSLGESAKADDGGRVDLVGLGNPIKIIDGPILAALVAGNQLSVAVGNESLRVADTLTVQGTGPLAITLTESCRLADSGEVEISRDETLSISDVVAVAINTVLLVTNPSESLKIVDNFATSGIGGNLSANPSESIKINDQLTALRAGIVTTISESLGVSDAVAADLVVVLLSTNPAESLKVTDTAAASRDLTLSVSETFRLADSGEVEISRDEVIRITDTLTVALSGALSTNLSEGVKAADAVVGSTLNPERAALSEALSTVENLSVARIEAGALAVNLAEGFEVTDVPPLGTLDSEEASTSEVFKVADVLAAAIENFDISVVASESLKIADTPAVVRQLGVQIVDESLRTSDAVSSTIQLAVEVAESLVVVENTPSGRIDPLQVQVTEISKVTEEGPGITVGTTIAVFGASESLKITDVVTLALDPEQCEVSESFGIGDVVSTALDPEEAALLSEDLKIIDTVQASLDLLQVTLSESLEVTDGPLRFGRPKPIRVIGSYVSSLRTVGSYVTTIHAVGSYSEG